MPQHGQNQDIFQLRSGWRETGIRECVSESTCSKMSHRTYRRSEKEGGTCSLCFACIVTELTTFEGSWINGINAIIRTVSITHVIDIYIAATTRSYTSTSVLSWVITIYNQYKLPKIKLYVIKHKPLKPSLTNRVILIIRSISHWYSYSSC